MHNHFTGLFVLRSAADDNKAADVVFAAASPTL